MKLVTLSIIPLLAATAQASLIWTVGLPGDGWPDDGTNMNTGGGPTTNFIQELGENDLPGNPANTGGTGADRDIDDDYYFAGVYTTVQDGGTYTPIGTVAMNEENAERAFAGTDNSLRYHFNLPAFIGASDPLFVSWDANNLDQRAVEAPNSRYGVEVYFNGNLVAGETLITPAELGVINNTPTFTLADVNGATGEGFDNYVELRGINYNADGGGNWMGVDHVSLNQVPEPSTGLLVFFGGLALLPVLRRGRRK